ncbi:MAG: Permease of the drug/metabolite transporter (DMT) superfamily, partial [uncultured Frankineae bacterium]
AHRPPSPSDRRGAGSDECGELRGHAGAREGRLRRRRRAGRRAGGPLRPGRRGAARARPPGRAAAPPRPPARDARPARRGRLRRHEPVLLQRPRAHLGRSDGPAPLLLPGPRRRAGGGRARPAPTAARRRLRRAGHRGDGPDDRPGRRRAGERHRPGSRLGAGLRGVRARQQPGARCRRLCHGGVRAHRRRRLDRPAGPADPSRTAQLPGRLVGRGRRRPDRHGGRRDELLRRAGADRTGRQLGRVDGGAGGEHRRRRAGPRRAPQPAAGGRRGRRPAGRRGAGPPRRAGGRPRGRAGM